MSKEITLPVVERKILENLLHVQGELGAAREAGNDFLVRIQQMEAIRLLDKLGVTPCDICYHSRNYEKGKCPLESRCQSYVKLEEFKEENEEIKASFSLVFEVL
ncbi:MAG: hypothetical protein M0Z31_13745 [Clostridia bacterium]|nr:hypothetical protein [Clostridia bacterium]